MTAALLRVVVALPLAALVAFPERQATGVQELARDGSVVLTLEVVVPPRGPGPVSAPLARPAQPASITWRRRFVRGEPGEPGQPLAKAQIRELRFQLEAHAEVRAMPCGTETEEPTVPSERRDVSTRPCLLRYAGVRELLPSAWR